LFNYFYSNGAGNNLGITFSVWPSTLKGKENGLQPKQLVIPVRAMCVKD
jgi:hypothetical protein